MDSLALCLGFDVVVFVGFLGCFVVGWCLGLMWVGLILWICGILVYCASFL